MDKSCSGWRRQPGGRHDRCVECCWQSSRATIALDNTDALGQDRWTRWEIDLQEFVSSNPAYNKTKIYEWSSYCTDTDSETESICLCGVGGQWDEGSCAIGERTENDWVQEKWNENSKLDFAVGPVSPYYYVNYAGPIAVSDDEQYVYILDKYNGPPYRVYRYDITEDGLKNKVNSSNIADGPISLHDLEYIAEFGVVVAVEGTDFIDGSKLDHSQVYSLNDLSHISNFDVGSAPVAIAFDTVGGHVYISPTDVDDNGMFIIEYDIETQLQTNYYQVAGLLGSHALIVDNSGEYIYAAVDDLSDQDTHEPYNGSSFNIQKIKIIDEGTYPINDH